MDCRLDESTEESSAENALSCSVNDIAATGKRWKSQINQQGNENGADGMMGDSKTVLPNPELYNSEKVSCKEEDSRVESDKLMNCKGNENNLAEENPSGSRTMDESDNSDFVVEDVKVCDICGDAGREDLLATCCRCSDGAEHTYCMREMLEKVPEGDWMCEDCRYDEEMKNQKQREVVSENGKSSSPGKASGGNSNARLKLDTRSGNDPDMTIKDCSNVKILGKRPKEDAEVSSLFKRQAVESITGSPRTSGSSIVASVSQGNSLRNLDRAKEKLTHRSSSGAPVGSGDTESPRAFVTSPRRLTPQGSFLKSNSFGSLNAKPKVKLLDEAVPLKQKSVKEPPPLDIKEGIGKSYGKSLSFRTTRSGHYGNGESKVKMLSPKFSHNQDNKGFKHTKERSVLERKSSFKLERPVISSPRVSSSILNSKNEKQGCLDETAVSSASNNYQSRAVQSDSKTSSLSKIPSLTSRRASSNYVFTGDGKRQSSMTSDLRGAEQKASYKDQPFLSGSAGRHNDPNGCSIDESTQPKDSVSYDETIRENGNQSIQNTGIGGSNEVCQKCKGVGHLAQCCPVDGLPDVSTSKSLREVTNGSNDLKAAIEAALLRKPGICRKSRVDQSNDSSQSSKTGDVVSQDHFVGPVSKQNVYSGLVKDVVADAQNSTNACKHASLGDVETSTSRTGDGRPVLYDKKTNIRDSPFQLPSPISFLFKTWVIPEPEFTWQGIFEVHKNDRVESCDGVQAHLSARASPKVRSPVNKFPHKVVLNEAPRSSLWPLQFQEHGVKEDNVALYFFAKDVDSYEKSYNILLKNMIKNDLALKGIIDGVELLIFPSTQLPQQSQRWNMLYFLWGVFRAKRTSHFYQVCSIPEKNLSQQNNCIATVSLPENICSLEPVENNLTSNASLVSEMAVSKDGFDVSGVPSLVQVKETDTSNVETHGSILGSDALTSLQRSSEKEGGADLNCKPEAGEVQPSVQALFRYASSSSECMPGQHDAFRFPSKTASFHALVGGGMSNKWIAGTDHVSHSTTIGDGAKREEAPLVKVSVTTEPIRKDLSSSQLNNLICKRPQDDGKIILEAASTTSSQAIQIDDDEDEDVIVLGTNKRRKIGSDGSNCSNDQSSSSNDEFSMRVHDIASGPSVIVSGETFGGKITSSEWGNTERFFFPVDPATVEHIGAADKSMPGRTHPLDNQVRVESPNLDLALGGETGLSEPGIPSFLIDKKVMEDAHPQKHAKGEEEDISGSLSLSLSFPFSDKEQDRTSISRAGQLTERPQVNPPFLLFGGIRDK